MAPIIVPNLCSDNSSQMSVTLQVLMNTHGFLELLRQHVEIDGCIRNPCFVCKIEGLVKSLQVNDKDVIKKLKELYEECNGDLSDACLFFKTILSKMRELDRCNFVPNKNAIVQLFGGLKSDIETCLICQTSSSNEELFIVLQIPTSIGRTQTIQEALESYLIGTMEKSICQACGECENVQSIRLTTMPPVLCLYFPHPLETDQANVQTKVTVQDQLVMSDVIYDLTSIILCSPNKSNHYTCILKNERTLLCINDFQCKNMSYGTLLSGSFKGDVYMVLYEKRSILSPQHFTPQKHGGKEKNKITSTSKTWTLEPLDTQGNNEKESRDCKESEHQGTSKRVVKKLKTKREEQATAMQNGLKTVYIRCIICHELWQENLSEKDFLFFVGLSKYNFEALFILLGCEDGLMTIKYEYNMSTPDPKRKVAAPLKLSARSRLLLLLVRMRRGTPLRDLAYQFGISTSYASYICFGVLRKVATTFRSMQSALFLTRQQQQLNRPAPFKPFPDVRIIIDGVEFRTQVPSNAEQQKNTWSQYKKSNTFKYMIGISCYGGVTFVSQGFEGSKSDKEIMLKCGLMDLLETGDAVMCDRGFNVTTELLTIGVTTIKPPTFRGKTEFTPEEQLYNSAVSQARIYVEHAIGKIKEFRLLRFTIPLNMRGMMDDLVYVAAFLTNFSDRAIKSRTKKHSANANDLV